MERCAGHTPGLITPDPSNGSDHGVGSDIIHIESRNLIRGLALLAVYVDDLIFATTHDSLREHVLGDLRREFQITDTGPLTWVLGSNVSQNLQEGTVTLSQKLYVEDITKVVLSGEQPQLDKGSRVNPASETLIKLEPGDAGNPNILYRKGVGMLAWLVAISRPDLAYTQSMLARYSGCGGESHLKCLVHAVQYLQRTKSYSITYRKQGSDKLLDSIQAHSKFRPEALDAEDLISFTDMRRAGGRSRWREKYTSSRVAQ